MYALAEADGLDLTFLTVIPTAAATAAKRRAEDTLRRSADIYARPEGHIVVAQDDDGPGAIVRAAEGMDLVLLGMRNEPWLRSFFFGPLAHQVAGAAGVPCAADQDVCTREVEAETTAPRLKSGAATRRARRCAGPSPRFRVNTAPHVYRVRVCFSPEADIVASLVVTGVGIDALRHVGHERELAMAALPVVFGVHQAIEVAVWWGFDGRVSADLATGAAWLYLAIAFGMIPIAVPFAVRNLETDRRRRTMMTPLVALGGIVAISLMIPVVRGPISVVDAGNHIAYSAPFLLGGLFTIGYVAATCGALLLASDRVVVVYGAFNLATVTTLAALLTTGVISLWCVFAAVTSIAIAIHLRRQHPGHVAIPAEAPTG